MATAHLLEVATLTVTLEHILDAEAQEKLRMAYTVRGFSTDAYFAPEQVEEVINTYMVIFLHILNISGLMKEKIRDCRDIIFEDYLAWLESQKFI